MIRILSYNILLGGTGRIRQLSQIIQSAEPTIVGLVEATNANVVETLAERTGMHSYMTGRGNHPRDWQLALLSCLPILESHRHTHPAFTRKYLLEARIELPDGSPLSVFVIHQISSFLPREKQYMIRRAEIQAILQIMAARKGTPHVLMGDFNSLTPGEPLQGSAILRYVLHEQDKMLQTNQQTLIQQPTFRRRAIRTTLHHLLRNRLACTAFDLISPRYAQGGIDLLLQSGYIDCFRAANPGAQGFTFPSLQPACRIDFIFASPELAPYLQASEAPKQCGIMHCSEASDHLPVWADFRLLEGKD